MDSSVALVFDYLSRVLGLFRDLALVILMFAVAFFLRDWKRR